MISAETDSRSSISAAEEPVLRVDGKDMFRREHDGRAVESVDYSDITGHVKAMHATWSTGTQPLLHEVNLKHHKVSLCHDAGDTPAPEPQEFLPALESEPMEKDSNDLCTLVSTGGLNLDLSRDQSSLEDTKPTAVHRILSPMLLTHIVHEVLRDLGNTPKSVDTTSESLPSVSTMHPFSSLKTYEQPSHEKERFSKSLSQLSPEPLRKQTSTQKQGIVRNVLPIQIKDNTYDAIPDTGSLKNIISQDYARLIGVSVDRNSRKQHTFANAIGKTFKSLGEAVLKFSFPDQPRIIYEETFIVVQQCAAPLVLGKAFLRMTETFSRFRHRLKKAVASVSQPWRLMYTGSSGLHVSCIVGAKPVLANVDTGSDKDFISLRYARSRRWKVVHLPRHIGFVELADGTKTKVVGYVDAPLEIGGIKYLKRWYILHDLACDVLIGDETIEETDLFVTHSKQLLNTDAVDEQYAFHLMKWIEELQDHVDNFLEDSKYEIPSSFDLSMFLSLIHEATVGIIANAVRIS